MASIAARAPSTRLRPLQMRGFRPWGDPRPGLERWLEAECDQLPLWLPVMLGMGMAGWLILSTPAMWMAVLLGCLGFSGIAVALGRGGRIARVAAIAGISIALGCALIWWRAERVAAPVLARPVVAIVTGRVTQVERFPARELIRARIATEGTGIPPVVRINIAEHDAGDGLAPGAIVHLRARLMPPAPAIVPGAHDFSRVAWFAGIGATGRALGPPTILHATKKPGDAMRATLTRHIQSRIEGSAGGIAAALVTGDRGAITSEDDEALRRSGLAHLLSVSGLHVTAVVGATMLIVLRLLALVPALALRIRLPVVAALAAAAVAAFYTWLTGAEVPTIRSLVAALIVLAALALGREAITLRLIATGAMIVLLIWPESIASASFQLSFAAVTAIVALHEHPRVRDWFAPRDESAFRRIGRNLGSLLLTGLVIEFALMPIGLFHFHKAGVYGALANIVAIPLTTFVIMPLEAMALMFDAIEMGGPFWWLAEVALKGVLWIAHTTSAAPGSVRALPAMPVAAFGLMVGGGLWIALWRTRWRWIGTAPFMIGVLWAVATPSPDLIVTGDGRHLAVRGPGDGLYLLRERSGDYVRDILSEAGGLDGDLPSLDDAARAKCSPDICIVTVDVATRRWTIAATRSADYLLIGQMLDICRTSDIVVSDRRLPKSCRPKWLRLDKASLRKTGGVSIALDAPSVTTARDGGMHPWKHPDTIMPPREQRTPDSRRQSKADERSPG